ncbi:MAG: hypothetical protein E7527_04020 [Ruminococcaceae bacterium]|nr:hypothetical protein [Oscillospiraceae bacterium]
MNKWVYRIAWLFTLPLLFLTGCGETATAPPITDGFTCHTAVTYREMSLEGDLTCGKDGSVRMAFDQPKSLYGIALRWDGTEMQMELGEMSLAVPAEKVPQSALLCCLARVLSADHDAGSRTDEGYVITGQVEGKAYELVCDPASGTPVSLSIPEEELSATFTEFQALESTP